MGGLMQYADMEKERNVWKILLHFEKLIQMPLNSLSAAAFERKLFKSILMSDENR
jgi:hypothetical protein